MSEQVAVKPARPRRRLVREVIESVALALLIYALVVAFIPPFQVEGASMSPNLQNGERLLVNRGIYFHFDVNQLLNLLPGENRHSKHVVYPFDTPHRGDIIVFNPPVPSDKPYIKRVIGLPGETVTFHGGYVYIDGKRLDEPYIAGSITRCGRGEYCHIGPIPAGEVYVLGDNRTNSSDSRYFGPVPIDRIIGKAWIANWPPKDIGRVPNYAFPQQ